VILRAPLRRPRAAFAGRAFRLAAGAWLLLAISTLSAQVSPQVATDGRVSAAEGGAVVSRAIELEHQSASEALLLVRPLLSPRGAVELLAESNTLVVRDIASALSVVLPMLHAFDHPPAALKVEIQIIQAGTSAEVPSTGPPIAPALRQRLTKLLRFENYQLLARTQFTAREGELVAYQIGDFGVSFRLGTMVEGQRVKLHGFRVVREGGRPAEKQLIHSNLNPWLDQTTILGLANDESAGRALMVVVTCSKEP
jgi:hypothetical protein